MVKLIMSKTIYKILLAIFILFTINSLIVVYVNTNNVSQDFVDTAKKNTKMLSESIFISLKTGMSSGDRVLVDRAIEESKGIKGVSNLNVFKGKPLMELLGGTNSVKMDRDVSRAFSLKKR